MFHCPEATQVKVSLIRFSDFLAFSIKLDVIKNKNKIKIKKLKKKGIIRRKKIHSWKVRERRDQR